MKQYTWTVTVDADSEADGAFPDLDSPDIATPEGEAVAVMEGEKAPAPEAGKGTETHRVVCTFSRLRGRITVSIDEDAFDLPAGFLGLCAARREIFRLGAEQAVLAVDRRGHASLILRGNTLPPEVS